MIFGFDFSSLDFIICCLFCLVYMDLLYWDEKSCVK